VHFLKAFVGSGGMTALLL